MDKKCSQHAQGFHHEAGASDARERILTARKFDCNLRVSRAMYSTDNCCTYMFVLNNTRSKHQSEAAGAHLVLPNIRDFMK